MSCTTESTSPVDRADEIKAFWDAQAMRRKTSDLATAPDHYYRNLEIGKISQYILRDASILDIGCGNGYSTAQFARDNKSSTFLGVDYSDAMIEQAVVTAKAMFLPNLSFKVGNILELYRLNQKFDLIICTRCLINLQSWRKQQTALLQMKNALNMGGRLILVENVQEGLNNLNKLREQMMLPQIEAPWHNKYLPYNDLIAFLKEQFHIQHSENIGNLYYIISRVVYAKLAQIEGKEPSYDNMINKIASELPSLPGYHYSPNFMFILRKL